MFRVEKDFRFEASHFLPEHDGKCRRLHGHSYTGRVVVAGERLVDGGPKDGMLVDFGVLGAALKLVVDERLDHRHLNEATGLRAPTAEALARWIFEELRRDAVLSLALSEAGARLEAVTVEETRTSRATYSPASPVSGCGVASSVLRYT